MLPIDLRSDTVTLPTEEMRKAIYAAEVGDDSYGADRTVIRLEEMVTELFGKEAALFVPSGTLGNILAVQTHRQLQERKRVIVGTTSHLNKRELPGMQSLLQLELDVVDDQTGSLDLKVLTGKINSDVALISIENTHNFSSGAVVPLEHMQKTYYLARHHQIPIHLDGARLWNAMVTTGTSAKLYGQYVDSIMVCLSKGLSAPVGSLLIGSKDFIAEARKWRKRFGGGMRQAGVLAAAGIVALTSMIDRLVEDHHHAQRLAKALSEINGLTIRSPKVETNIVIIQLSEHSLPAQELTVLLKKEGILVKELGDREIRLTTHRHIQTKHIDYVVQKIQEIIAIKWTN